MKMRSLLAVGVATALSARIDGDFNTQALTVGLRDKFGL